MNTATFGVPPADAGVASATANTQQQIGTSIGTALLNTIAVSAGILAAGAIICGTLLRRGPLAGQGDSGQAGPRPRTRS
jgi:hypothetical protein